MIVRLQVEHLDPTHRIIELQHEVDTTDNYLSESGIVNVLGHNLVDDMVRHLEVKGK